MSDRAPPTFVGHTKEDMQAAAAANVSTVAHLTEIYGERRLRAACATHTRANLATIGQLIDALVPAPSFEPRT